MANSNIQKLVREFIKNRKSDYEFKTFTSALISFLTSIGFSAYNAFLGIYYSSIWNGTISVYYILLSVIRGYVIYSRKRESGMSGQPLHKFRKKVYVRSHILLFAINLILIFPITVMIEGDRTYDLGLIPAIAIAAYTTYRITMAVREYIKVRNHRNLFIRELRVINLIDTLVAVLTLQNTLIITMDGEISDSMKVLSIVTSTAFWLLILFICSMSLKYAGNEQHKS